MKGRRSNGRVQCLFVQPINSQSGSRQGGREQKIKSREERYQKVFNKKPEKKMIIQGVRNEPVKPIRIKHPEREDSQLKYIQKISKEKAQSQPSCDKTQKETQNSKAEEPVKVQNTEPIVKDNNISNFLKSEKNDFREQPKRTRKNVDDKEEKDRKLNIIAMKLDRIKKLNEVVRTNSNTSITPKEDLEQRPQKTKSVLVDLYYPKPNLVRVYVDSVKNFPYSTTMNQSNVQSNANKFYIMQVLQSIENPDDCYFFTRWGRVGLAGQTSQMGPMSAQEAVDNFHTKLVEKLKKSYKQVEVTYQSERRNYYFPKTGNKRNEVIESKLDVRVQQLIKLIFDMKMMNNQMKEIGYDSKKMPLGKVAKSTIVKGYEALKQLMQEIRGKRRAQSINEWSSLFYSHIPHDFGMKNIANFALDTQQKVKGKLQLLQSLQDIQIFTKMIDQMPIDNELNELDMNYGRLKIDIKPLEKDHPEYKVIMKYVQNTHAETHNHFNLQVDTIFTVHSQQEESRYRKDIHNKQLLWHGSRLTNYVGILSQGLRIAPPQAPATGYMFGKGVYFADVVSKSANYCQATKSNPIGCLLLCEVALGNPTEKYYADFNANLMTEQFHSTKGIGKSAPKQGQTLHDIYVPNGPIHPTGISNTSLQYNEYVVYDVCQIKIRYLLKVRFHIK